MSSSLLAAAEEFKRIRHGMAWRPMHTRELRGKSTVKNLPWPANIILLVRPSLPRFVQPQRDDRDDRDCRDEIALLAITTSSSSSSSCHRHCHPHRPRRPRPPCLRSYSSPYHLRPRRHRAYSFLSTMRINDTIYLFSARETDLETLQ